MAAYAPEWLEFIKEQLLKDEDSSIIATYHDSYIETPYSKGTTEDSAQVGGFSVLTRPLSTGVVGGMKETGWQASHGPGDSGLTHSVLGDITWAFWKTVNSSLRWSLDRELTPEESNALVERMAVCQAKLVDLWLTTVNNRYLLPSLASKRSGTHPICVRGIVKPVRPTRASFRRSGRRRRRRSRPS